MTDKPVPPLTGPLFELLAQSEEMSRLASDISKAAARIAAMRGEKKQEGQDDDRPDA
jgi:hypothetical protein